MASRSSSDPARRAGMSSTGRTVVPSDRTRKAMAKRLAARTSAMTTATLAQMAERHSWFRELSADDRSWISIVARNGIDGFVRWFADDEAEPYSPTDVFDVAPRSMTRKISLHQTVDLVRTTIEVVEEQITEKMPRGDRSVLSNAIVHYSREVAFAAAEVYARAAEQRGTWDERLESLVVDAIVRDDVDDEQLASRASTLGWKPGSSLCVVVGSEGGPRAPHGLRRAGEHAHLSVLAAVQSDRMVAVVSGALADDTSAMSAVEPLAEHFGDGPVVVGPVVADLTGAPDSARAALSAARAAVAWPEGPRLIASADVIPERVLAGDRQAIDWLVTEVFTPLNEATGDLMDTAVSFLDHGGSVEGTGRAMYIHPNTVRYRLKKIQDVTGYSPSDPREAYLLRLAVTLGRLRG